MYSMQKALVRRFFYACWAIAAVSLSVYGSSGSDVAIYNKMEGRPAYLSLLVFNRPYVGCSFFGSYGWYNLCKPAKCSSNSGNSGSKNSQTSKKDEKIVEVGFNSFGLSVHCGFGYIFMRYGYVSLDFGGNSHIAQGTDIVLPCSNNGDDHTYSLRNHLLNLNTMVTLGVLIPSIRVIIGGDVGIETAEAHHISFSQTYFLLGARVMWNISRKISLNARCTYKFGRRVRCALLPNGEKDTNTAMNHAFNCEHGGGALHYSVGLVIHL